MWRRLYSVRFWFVAWTCDQPCVCEELAERLVDVLGYGPVGQSEHWQINALLEQVLKRDVAYVFDSLMDAFEVIDGADCCR